MNNGSNASGPIGGQSHASPNPAQGVVYDKAPPTQMPVNIQNQPLPNDGLSNNPTGSMRTTTKLQSDDSTSNDSLNKSQDVAIGYHNFSGNNQNLTNIQASTNDPSSSVQSPNNYQQSQAPLPTQPVLQPIKPLLIDEAKGDIAMEIPPESQMKQESQAPQKGFITKVKLSDELNIFDWLRTSDIINHIAEKAKSSVDSVITTLDPGMKEYLYSGGNINVMVISDSERLVSPIRDAFQGVFGRATVAQARFSQPGRIIDYPIRTACGMKEAAVVAQEKIKMLRLDASSVPQNQVFVVVQPALVHVDHEQLNDKSENLNWYITYCMLIDDPVLGVIRESYSQFIPVDSDVIDEAKASKFPDAFQDRHLGFSVSIDELMVAKLRLGLEGLAGNEYGCSWLPRWAGQYETQLIHQVSLALANAYRRKWDDCTRLETVS